MLETIGLEKGVDFQGEGAFLNGSYTLVFQFTVFEEEDGGHVADAEAGGDRRAFFHVGFAHGGAAFIFVGNFFHYGSKGFAGATPGGSKVDHYYCIVLQNFVEILFCDGDFHCIS